MWQCPKCKREFKNTNQGHYCGETPKTIADYIKAQPDEVQPILHKIHETIRAEAPDATEKIAWHIPSYWQGENIIHFAAFKKTVNIYPGDLSLAPFVERLEGLLTTKGAVQFRYDMPVDYDLIAEITRYRVSSLNDRRKPYEFDAVIQKAHDDKDTAYVAVPIDIKTEFGKGRLKVHATFDEVSYDGSVVNIGVKTRTVQSVISLVFARIFALRLVNRPEK